MTQFSLISRKFIALIIGLSTFLLALYAHSADLNNLPELGDDSQTVLSSYEEKIIAEQILRDISTSDEVLQDVEVIDYLQSLGQRLVNASPEKQLIFNFFVVKDNSINAFTLPGGIIGVHTGLILATGTESELAGVLGHEIGHVTQHHLARMLASQKHDLFKNVGAVAVALLAARANPEFASGMLATASGANIQRELDYTRDHEREADRVGLQILEKANFDVRAMPDFFTTLQRGTRFVEGAAPSFLRTHPLTTERIADMENRVDHMPYKQVADSLMFQMVRAKLRAFTESPGAIIANFEGNLAERRFANEIAEHYGLAVALLRRNDPNKHDLDRANTQIEWLNVHAPFNPMVDTLNARIEVAKNHLQQATLAYAKSLDSFPSYRALIFDYTEHLLASNQPDKAIKLINEKLNFYPNDAYFYMLSTRAYTMQNKTLLRHQALGEAYFRQYNLAKAVEQMELASKANDGNFYEKSIVEARLKELRLQLKNEKDS